MHFYYLLIAFLIELVGTLFDTYVFISIIASLPLLVDYWSPRVSSVCSQCLDTDTVGQFYIYFFYRIIQYFKSCNYYQAQVTLDKFCQSCLDPMVFLSPKDLNYLAFTYFCFDQSYSRHESRALKMISTFLLQLFFNSILILRRRV